MKENWINANSMGFMKIKKRYWVTSAIAASLVSGALIVNACVSANNNPLSISQKEKAMSQASSSQTVDFRFEDYETAEAAQEKLQSLFPVASNLNRFTEVMVKLGAECHQSANEDEENVVYCYYSQKPDFLVRTQWIVGIEFDNNKKIKSFTKVERGFVGP